MEKHGCTRQCVASGRKIWGEKRQQLLRRSQAPGALVAGAADICGRVGGDILSVSVMFVLV